MIFENNIHREMYKYLDIIIIYFFVSIADLKCTPSDGQCAPRGTCKPGWEPLF